MRSWCTRRWRTVALLTVVKLYLACFKWETALHQELYWCSAVVSNQVAPMMVRSPPRTLFDRDGVDHCDESLSGALVSCLSQEESKVGMPCM